MMFRRLCKSVPFLYKWKKKKDYEACIRWIEPVVIYRLFGAKKDI